MPEDNDNCIQLSSIYTIYSIRYFPSDWNIGYLVESAESSLEDIAVRAESVR